MRPSLGRAAHRRPRRRRTAGLAAHHRHDPRRHHRLLFEHTFRTLFAKPLAAAIFLTINGLILLAGEWLRRRAPTGSDDSAADAGPVRGTQAGGTTKVSERTSRRLATLHYREAGVIGFLQTSALLAGISRSGVTMVGGLARGLSHRDAARFSFLLATPVSSPPAC